MWRLRSVAGLAAYRRIVVRNNNRAGSQPIQVTAATTGAPFTIVGPRTIRIKPGEVRRLLVRFAPTEVGQARGTAFLYPFDRPPGEVAPTVRLAGRGVGA